MKTKKRFGIKPISASALKAKQKAVKFTDDEHGYKTYLTRADQIRGFEIEVLTGERTLFEALKSAAMVGAVEERDRVLSMLSGKHPVISKDRICEVSVLSVLGFSE